MKNCIVINREVNNGIQSLFRFPNNYGASIVCHDYSYGGDIGLYELAVIVFDEDRPDNSSWDIVYDTPITSNVLTYLTQEDCVDALMKIEALPGQSEESKIKLRGKRENENDEIEAYSTACFIRKIEKLTSTFLSI